MNVQEEKLEEQIASLKTGLEAAIQQNGALTSWIRAARQFAWAHEKDCPRYTGDGPCDCGLDQFLSRPRPFIESYKQELAAAIQRIAELELSNRDGQRLINELNWQLAEAERAKEAAERQRATVLTALTDIRKYIDNFDGSWDIDHIYGLVMYALAQIEQPQEDSAGGKP